MFYQSSKLSKYLRHFDIMMFRKSTELYLEDFRCRCKCFSHLCHSLHCATQKQAPTSVEGAECAVGPLLQPSFQKTSCHWEQQNLPNGCTHTSDGKFELRLSRHSISLTRCPYRAILRPSRFYTLPGEKVSYVEEDIKKKLMLTT
jgi:hypothetical protein